MIETKFKKHIILDILMNRSRYSMYLFNFHVMSPPLWIKGHPKKKCVYCPAVGRNWGQWGSRNVLLFFGGVG